MVQLSNAEDEVFAAVCKYKNVKKKKRGKKAFMKNFKFIAFQSNDLKGNRMPFFAKCKEKVNPTFPLQCALVVKAIWKIISLPIVCIYIYTHNGECTVSVHVTFDFSFSNWFHCWWMNWMKYIFIGWQSKASFPIEHFPAIPWSRKLKDSNIYSKTQVHKGEEGKRVWQWSVCSYFEMINWAKNL